MVTNLNLVEYFDELSQSYVANERASFFLTNYMRHKLIKNVSSFKDKDVLDIMSGKGENLKYINQNNTRITTLDFSHKMNEASRRYHSDKTIHQIESNFFEVNLKSETYDIILCSFGVKTITPKQLNTFAKKVNHLLKPNGEILLLELVKPKKNMNYNLIKFYLNTVIPALFGKQFKALFPYINTHKNMNDLKLNLKTEHLKIIKHHRVLDLFEIMHAKKQSKII